ncbi:MAG: PEGA domain-containing protein [Blastocatellia bacterium]|nr:PEGA domain-containing protein [Blastocatellia bacterium]
MCCLLLLLLTAIIQPLPSAYPYSQDIGVRAGNIEKPLKRPRRTSKSSFTLTIISNPYECEIYINDAYRGTTALKDGRLVIPNLKPKTYTLRVYKSGLGEILQKIQIKSDTTLSVSLSEQK